MFSKRYDLMKNDKFAPSYAQLFTYDQFGPESGRTQIWDGRPNPAEKHTFLIVNDLLNQKPRNKSHKLKHKINKLKITQNQKHQVDKINQLIN